MTTLKFDIDEMSCAGCASRAEQALSGVQGVEDAQVNIATHRGKVTLGENGQARDLVSALKAAGYPAVPNKERLAITGMTCGSCAARTEAALQAVPGVIDAQVNLANSEARVTWLGSDPAPLIDAVAAAGYQAEPLDAQTRSAGPDHEAEAQALKRRLIFAAALTLPVFILEMGGHAIPAFHAWQVSTFGHTALWGLQFVLVSVLLAGPGRVFFAKGWPALRRGAPDMNSLVMLGAGAAYLYSTVVLFFPSVIPPSSYAVYFEAAAMIVTLILAGRWMEARAKGRTGTAIKALMDLTPDTAQVERDGGVFEIPLAEVQRGDILRVAPGARVPVDGVLREGHSFIDESMMTGEPIAVEKQRGDRLTGGTVNGSGPLRMRATDVGANTVLARIVSMVEEAQGARLPVQDLVNRITLWFVPGIIAVSILTTLIWLILGPGLAHALVAGVSVMIIACPCAMGLAVPVSIMVGTGRGAEIGVLFREGGALQALATVKLVAFDKTGTLTQGKPELSDITLLADAEVDEDTLLAEIAAIEALSEHPLASAIIAAAKARGLNLPKARDVSARPGQGITGKAGSDGQDASVLAIGNLRLMAADGIGSAAFQQAVDELSDAGRTPVLVARNGTPAAVLGLMDAPRDSARATVEALHGAGMRVAMVSGDTAKAAKAVAARLGIDEVHADLMPEDKVDAIREMQKHGPVAFVGDGINDAPALAAANVGLAIGSGTDVAMESADVVLMSGDPMGAAKAVRLSRATMRNIRQNLGWAFGYNVALVPVAAGVLYPFTGYMLSPALAAAAMALSSVLVLTNALRLRRAG